jgi:hypothetical protein
MRLTCCCCSCGFVVHVSSAVQGTASPQDAADRLLSSVYMAIVSDVGEAEGLSEEQVRPGRPLPRAGSDWLIMSDNRL